MSCCFYNTIIWSYHAYTQTLFINNLQSSISNSIDVVFHVLFVHIAGIIPLGVQCIYCPHGQENCQTPSNKPNYLYSNNSQRLSDRDLAYR